METPNITGYHSFIMENLLNSTSTVMEHLLNSTSTVMEQPFNTTAPALEPLPNSTSAVVTEHTTLDELVEITTFTPQTTTTMPVIRPALPATVELSLTIVYFVMFGLLFILVYAQLWMIWHYRHKRLSHQTIFLFLCLMWAGLRTTLFSFYFFDCDKANSLSVLFYWLLYSFPVCLQFSMLCLLLHFFAQVSFACFFFLICCTAVAAVTLLIATKY